MELQGNMSRFYEGDIMKLGVFIATYPETVTELARWAVTDEHKVRDFIRECQRIAAKRYIARGPTTANEIPQQA